MALSPGTRIGPCEVVSKLGEGGMGEVYRARDTQLDRDVALKVLPESFASDADRVMRFKREAQTLAALNHPHIAQIYGVEHTADTSALVMELVEGEDLAERLKRGAIPLDEALPIARQIAEALEAAHDAGIVHRDLKPANIKVRPDGTVKILDFGLAKALQDPRTSGPQDLSRSPTITTPAMTQAGMILGTAAYMAPEQAKGRTVDRRADIWAFGCVLYEMLAGARAFDGEDTTEILGAIVKTEPDWTRLPSNMPPTIRALVQRCLLKDVRRRLPHIAVARQDLESPPQPPDALANAGYARRRWVPLVWAAIGFATAAAILAVPAFSRRAPPVASTPIVSSIEVPSEISVQPGSSFAISPDGQRLAFVALDAQGRNVLWIRRLSSRAAQAITGTEGASGPFWSPDSRHVAFITSGQLKRVDVSGGPVIALADGSAGTPGSWSQDDVVLFTRARQIVRVSAKGGAAVPTNALLYYPRFLPDGRQFLYLSDRNVYVRSIADDTQTLLLENAGNAAVASGHLFYLRESTLFAQPFDPDRLTLSGDPFPLADRVELNTGSGAGAFSVSDTGVLVYQTVSLSPSRLVWIDRSGREAGVIGEPGPYSEARLSADGSRIAVSMWSESGGDRDIWLLDARRGVRTRLTTGTDDDSDAVLSPDGRSIAYASRRGHVKTLFVRNLEASTEAVRLVEDGFNKYPSHWSPDGNSVIYTTMTPLSFMDVSVVPVTAGQPPPRPALQTGSSEALAEWSPSGTLIAFQSNETGRREVYVARYPVGAERWPVSVSGGMNPHWSRDGKELFFISGTTMMRARVTVNATTVDISAPEPLFQLPFRPRPNDGGTSNVFDVSPDGQRFLFKIPVDSMPTPLTLIVNWPALLPQ